MLLHLTIRNFAIIDALELEFESGLTALTGETGAGKSILLGALGLVLGDRADNDSIKQDADHAEIVAEFDTQNNETVSSWLVEQALNVDDECILRRRVSKDGRSRAYINGTPVNLNIIRELGEMLIDIHGQHEHQSLMKPVVQRQLLDDYANHANLIEAVSNAFVQLKLVEEQLQHLEQASSDRNNRLDLLRFQTQELDALALEENEYQTLNEKHARLAHAEKLTSTVQQSLEELYSGEDSNLYSDLSRTIASLQDIAEVDEKLNPVIDLLQEALVQIDEGVSQLRTYGDSLELNPTELENVEQRLQVILDLARKHRIEPETLTKLHQQLSEELNELDHADERLEELRAEYKTLQQTYSNTAKALSSSRNKAAKKLNRAISSAMQTLGMSGGQFVIEITQNDDDKRSAHGLDKIDFMVTANAGQACKALSRVASGGELARISLAIQMIIASQARIPTLIFDEVDSGVGGGIAEIVGQHLRTLGGNNQVVCITHLPQVASQAHHHMRVHKQSGKQQTSTCVDTLERQQRIEEIARMLSGVDITQQSLAHAEEMITRAEEH
ncbi:MAG: DNA repair protein RecN [Gammaproteobacteria bacterium]|nr:DNA repair protein RecN [Gammaproteobacteria bacterium]MCW8922606.1 DNA repair protein RecN [Gammaproteobacteria bacterium]